MAFQSNSKRKLGKEDKQNRLLNNLWQVVDANPGHYNLPPGDEKPCKLVDHICGRDLHLCTIGLQRIKNHSESSKHVKALEDVNAASIATRQAEIQPFLMPELQQQSTEGKNSKARVSVSQFVARTHAFTMP